MAKPSYLLFSMNVKDAKGNVAKWSLETRSPSALMLRGCAKP